MRNVIVTGGSRGLGLGLARRLTRAGYRVIALARKETNQLTLAMEEAERAHPGSFHFVPFDLAETAAIATLAGARGRAHGRDRELDRPRFPGHRHDAWTRRRAPPADRAAQRAAPPPGGRRRGGRRRVPARRRGEEHHGHRAHGRRGQHGMTTIREHAPGSVTIRDGGPAARSAGPTRVWLRALELTAPITTTPHRILPAVIEELAERFAEAPALLSEGECLTYRGLAARANRYARWALDRGLVKGDVVGLFMLNRPEYMAIWLGITRIGGVVALLNTNLSGAALAHAVNLVAPRHVIVAAELLEPFTRALPDLARAPRIWAHGDGPGDFPRIDGGIERLAGDALGAAEARPTTIEDRALYIYTSGTTGLPKAARVSHARLMQWSHWFAGMMDTRASDRMYNCLPIYHSVGGGLATGAVLVGGGSVVIRDKFSARQFWPDVIRWDCTLFQYIGELCRYLVHTERAPHDTEHRIRLACGNGLRPDVWNDFKIRFRIPH